jgi:hypothetical protein
LRLRRLSSPQAASSGRAACELLEDDRAHECAEGPVRIAWAMADRSDTRDEIRDDGISRSDLVDCDALSGWRHR